MDDLDRLFRRLVLNVRDGAPHLLDRQFRLGDIASHLVPYRHMRRELGFDSIQQYEHALLRLAAGERGYLRTEAPVQETMRRALAGPHVDGEPLRAHGDAPVALAPDALARADVDGGRPGTPARPTPAHATPAPGELPPAPAAADLERAVLASSQVADAWSELARQPRTPAPPPPPPPPAPMPAPAPRVMDAPAGHTGPATGGACRYCAQPLPEGRRITFCPYCGNNVTVRQCPACSTELEVGWRFCITCGRSTDDADAGAESR